MLFPLLALLLALESTPALQAQPLPLQPLAERAAIFPPSSEASHHTCLTPLLVEQLRALPSPPDWAQTRRLPWTETPVPAEGSLASETLPLRVHYRLLEQQALAATVLQQAEQSYRREVEDIGFLPPEPDGVGGGDERLDFYLASYANTNGGAYTVPTFQDLRPGDGRQSCPTYILLYEGIAPELMPVYVAHELNHALQAATDFRESPWAWEMTATWIEDVVYDEVNDYTHFIPPFQQNANRSLYWSAGRGEAPLYPYGASIFLHFLQEATADGQPYFITDLWMYAQQDESTNEPDLLDALYAYARAYDPAGFDPLFAQFSLWRAFTGTQDVGAHFSEGAAWKDSEIPFRFTVSPEELPASGSFSQLEPLGVQYLQLTQADAPLPKHLELQLTSDGTGRAGLAVQVVPQEGPLPSPQLVFARSNQETLQLSLESQNARSLTVAVLNLSSEQLDAEDERAPAQFQLVLTSAGGCGCSTTSTGRSPFLASVFLFLSALFILHRRHW